MPFTFRKLFSKNVNHFVQYYFFSLEMFFVGSEKIKNFNLEYCFIVYCVGKYQISEPNFELKLSIVPKIKVVCLNYIEDAIFAQTN